MDKKIIFKIAKDGQLTVEGSGFQGESCLEKSKQYMQGLGLTSDEQKKPEYYETAGVQNDVLL